MNCAECGKELTGKHQSKYCSRDCMWAYQRRERAIASEAKRTRICEACGKEFVMPFMSSKAMRGEIKAGLYCSRKCRWDAIRKPEVKKVWYCKVCGKEMTVYTVYCSDECRKEMARQKALIYNQHKMLSKTTKERVCHECGCAFYSEYGSKRSAFCSDECGVRHARRDAKHIRRERFKDAFRDRVYKAQIYKRDGFRCQICGRKVNMTVSVPHPLAPTMDHIVALANGGKHEPKNVRLAHFICNSLRGARCSRGGDQLLLFG